MGIKGLSKLFKDSKTRGVYGGVPLSSFSGTYIAVDVTGIACVLMSAAHAAVVEKTNWGTNNLDLHAVTQEWIGLFLNRVSDMLELGIIPFFIFDGTPRPEKARIRARRLEKRLAMISEVKKHQEQMAQMSGNDRLYHSKNSKFDTLIKQNWRLGEEHIILLKKLIVKLGLPWLQARYDAEELGACLVKERFAYALYTEDSDALAFGAPVVIHKIKDYQIDGTGRRVPSCIVWLRDELLQDLGLTNESFLDLCILCGCDYNQPDPEKSPIAGISQARAYALIKQYGSIENLPQYPTGLINPYAIKYIPACRQLSANVTYDLQLLFLDDCRRIFTQGSVENLSLGGSVLLTDYNLDSLLAFLAEAGLKYNLNRINNLRNNLVPINVA